MKLPPVTCELEMLTGELKQGFAGKVTVQESEKLPLGQRLGSV